MQMLESIRRKIESAQDLHSVVKTMKALAAVNIRGYEKAVQAIGHYHQNIQTGMQVILKNNPEILKKPDIQKTRQTGFIIFGAQRGMAGNFNMPNITAVDQWIENRGLDRKSGLQSCAVGDRISEQLKDIGIFPDDVLDFPSFRYHLDETIQKLLLIIEQWRFEKNIPSIYLFYNHPTGGSSFEPTHFQLYPLDTDWLQELSKKKWPSRSIPMYTLSWNEIFNRMIRQYFYISIYRAFIESMSSENASRLAAMQKAEQNIEERLENLDAQFHHQRQNAITEELLDIVAGFEALTK